MKPKTKRSASSILLPAKTSLVSAEKVADEAEHLQQDTKRVHRKADQLHRGIERLHRKTDAIHRKVRQGPGGASLSFPIVGIGASAGGLEAVTQLLEQLPPNTGMAFALVQHLDPTHESALSELLSRITRMQVTEAKNNLPLQPNHVYIIPPNKIMGVHKRRLKLFPRTEGKADRMPIDHFLRSLAQEEGNRAVGIILSGNGSDGTQGLQAIKAAGGITFAQDEKSAKYSTMPRTAVTAGWVDFVGPCEAIARELNQIAKRLSQMPVLFEDGDAAFQPPADEKALSEILALLRTRMAVDFTFYKRATLRRRIARRIILQKLESLQEYARYLRSHPDEVKNLYNDILIHVTGFFRDAHVFILLKRKLFPLLFRNRGAHDTLRIWVPGCSTGEEVYSLAIALMEFMTSKKLQHPVQIFATDINDTALETARAGFYPENIKADVSAERLQRFFTRSDGGFRVNKMVREICIFARQNLAADPPFSNLGLISCRNLLIYLGPTLQRKIMPTFHYALRPGGFLMLGASETIGSFSDLFSLADKKAKLYSKKASQTRPAITFSRHSYEARIPNEMRELPAVPQRDFPPSLSDVQKQADRIVLTGHSPAGVVINKDLEVLQFRGRSSLYLEHPHGEANLHLFKMAREGLLLDLRAAVAKATKQNVRVRQAARVKQNSHSAECTIEIIPFSVPPTQDRFYLVLFEPKSDSEEGRKDKTARARKASAPRAAENSELTHLREELSSTRESLQAIIEEQEATNEELRSANEEIMSSNEELQSTNEELETAKEELQSTNEELTTLNDELEGRNTELEQVNNDLHNLLASVSMPVLILDAELRIRRFTAVAEKLFKLIPADLGRPITDINLPLDIPNLKREVLDVFDSLAPRDIEIKDKQGHWWSMRIRAYKTTDHKIDGAVLALVDIDALKTSINRIDQSRSFAEAIVNTVREPLLVLDENLFVKSANDVFYRTFRVPAAETINRRIYELGNGQWNIPSLRTLLEEILAQNSSFNDYVVEHDFQHLGKKRMVLNARRLTFEGQPNQMILLAIEDATAASSSV